MLYLFFLLWFSIKKSPHLGPDSFSQLFREKKVDFAELCEFQAHSVYNQNMHISFFCQATVELERFCSWLGFRIHLGIFTNMQNVMLYILKNKQNETLHNLTICVHED